MRLTFDEIRERLAELDRRDPERKIFDAKSHQYQLNPPLAMDRVEQVESLFGCRLPEQYRRFVTEFADGGAGPDHGIETLESWLNPKIKRSSLAKLAQPFPAPTTVAQMRKMKYSSPGAMEIAEIGCGGHYMLILSGSQRGFVWILNPDSEWSPELANEDHVPEYSEETGTDPIYEAVLASPDSLRLEFVDWYVKWLDDSLREASKTGSR